MFLLSTQTDFLPCTCSEFLIIFLNLLLSVLVTLLSLYLSFVFLRSSCCIFCSIPFPFLTFLSQPRFASPALILLSPSLVMASSDRAGGGTSASSGPGCASPSREPPLLTLGYDSAPTTPPRAVTPPGNGAGSGTLSPFQTLGAVAGGLTPSNSVYDFRMFSPMPAPPPMTARLYFHHTMQPVMAYRAAWAQSREP